MTTPTCYSSVDVLRIRVALLTAAGAPDDGSEHGYVSNGISVQRNAVIEEGDEFVQKNGDGSLCQVYRGCDKIKGVDITLQVCEADDQFSQLCIGGDLFGTATVIGSQWPDFDDACAAPVSVEWWTYAWDGDAQAVISGIPQYWHHVAPLVHFVPGDQTYDHGIAVYSLVGKGTGNRAITANGPFNDWPAGLNDGVTSAYGKFLDASLPVVTCDYVQVTSLAS